MLYKTYRPKGTSVKAIKVTPESAAYAATWCHGLVMETSGDELAAVKVPSFDGPKIVTEGEYLVLTQDKGFVVMSAEDFEDRFEAARTTRNLQADV